jgi:hypothetical protein
MAKKGKVRVERIHDAILASDASIGGVSGPGRWLVANFAPTSLFSLKASMATSSVGKTLLVPTPYSIKMALIDAAFRCGWDGDIGSLVEDLSETGLSIGVPEHAAVTHTIVKIRQEPKTRKPLEPYIAAVAYREFVYLHGEWQWAFDLASMPERAALAIIALLPAVNYIGKRGSFIQFLGFSRRETLGTSFTQPFELGSLAIPQRVHLAMLDDFGPEANLDALNSYSATPIRRDKHRKFVKTLVPMGVVNAGPGFTQYQATPKEDPSVG